MSQHSTVVRSVAAGCYVAFVMFAYGLSESFATHRVAITFGPAAVARVAAVACSCGVLAFFCGLLAGRADHCGSKRARAVLLAGSLMSCAGYFTLAHEPRHVIGGLLALTALVMWWASRSVRASLSWVGFTPAVLLMTCALLYHFPPFASVWLALLVGCVIASAMMVIQGELQSWTDNKAVGAIVLLVVLAASGAIAMPWPLATHYAAIKIFATATCAYASAALIWKLKAPTPRFSARTRGALGVLLAGAALHAAILTQGRTLAFGSHSLDTLVGKAMVLFYPARNIAEMEARRQTAHPRVTPSCPDTTRPRGVLWVVIDGLRADALDAERYPAVALLARESTTFSHAFSPANSTYTSFAIFLQHLPDERGVPWTIFSAQHPHARLEMALGNDLPDIDVGPSCDSEGARIAELAGGLEPGTLAIAYLPATHEPYRCTPAGQPLRACYRDAVDCVAEQLVPIIEWSRAHPDWALVVTADHGESLGEKSVEYHAISLWQEQVRVPLYIRAPGWPRGARVDTAISSAWLSGTLGCWLTDDASAFGAADVVLTSDPAARPFPIHGFSVHYGRSMWGWGATRETAVVDWPYKLILDRDTDYAQLFRLDHDPGERDNLADDEAGRVNDMRAMLDTLWGPPLTAR
ncbi:MAG: sulfatase-like hydrolase/transferase [Deltaproteobacteria bacterium]|nr:sulfatase-like hydrolase/transferase [Deltaproteobacteria bacterium]